MSEKAGKESQFGFAPFRPPRREGGGATSWYQSIPDFYSDPPIGSDQKQGATTTILAKEEEDMKNG